MSGYSHIIQLLFPWCAPIFVFRFYEWKKDGSRKQPYYIHFKDGRPLIFAALFDSWKNPEGEVPIKTLFFFFFTCEFISFETPFARSTVGFFLGCCVVFLAFQILLMANWKFFYFAQCGVGCWQIDSYCNIFPGSCMLSETSSKHYHQSCSILFSLFTMQEKSCIPSLSWRRLHHQLWNGSMVCNVVVILFISHLILGHEVWSMKAFFFSFFSFFTHRNACPILLSMQICRTVTSEFLHL